MNGVLGGYESVNDSDVNESSLFISDVCKHMLELKKSGKKLRALGKTMEIILFMS